MSAFYASASPEDDASGESVVEPSTSFRSRDVGTPDAPEVHSAHAELVARLKEDGWVPTGQGVEWYAAEFARSVLVPVAKTAVAPPSPEVAPPTQEEPEPASPPARSALPALPQAEPAAPAVVPAPTPVASAGRTTRRVDGWRIAAGAGLATAIALLGWVATHPSALPPGL
jgi:hypothetical protein